MLRRVLLPIAAVVIGAVALACCHGRSPTSPSDPASLAHGRLSGMVTIGPNCPVERPDQPCPTPPSAYALRKILIYDEGRTKLLHTVDIDSSGFYTIDLTPARYTVDLQGSGIDRSSDVPKVITITANAVMTLDISIDTGLR